MCIREGGKSSVSRNVAIECVRLTGLVFGSLSDERECSGFSVISSVGVRESGSSSVSVVWLVCVGVAVPVFSSMAGVREGGGPTVR